MAKKKNIMPLPREQISSYLYKVVLKRDNYKCVRCHTKRDLQLHHILPVYKGGPTIEANLITLCSFCHDHAPDNPRELFKYCTIHMSPDMERSRALAKFAVMICIKELGLTTLDPIRNKEIYKGMDGIIDSVFADIWEVMRSIVDKEDGDESMRKFGDLLTRLPTQEDVKQAMKG
jgi:hypothetical protein